MISVLQLGILDYSTALRLQQKLVHLRKQGQIGDVLLLLEHTPVITLGRNAKVSNILVSPEQLNRRGVELFECDRGGDVTFHGPGQLIAYPIFDLRAFPSTGSKRATMGAVEYVRNLEEVLIRVCADFGIPAERISGLTGVWTTPEPQKPSAKIAAIAVCIGVTLMLLSEANTAIVDLISIQFLMSRDGEMPPVFQKLNRYGVPGLGMLVAAVIPAILVVLVKDMSGLADLYAIGVVGAIATNLGASATDRKLALARWERILMLFTFQYFRRPLIHPLRHVPTNAECSTSERRVAQRILVLG